MEKKIDFVMIWVDGQDLQWQREKAKFDATATADDRVERYREWDILQYWFRGVEQFAPWVNKIHFVTWGHTPTWLDLDHPKLHFVKHSDYIPQEFLPTFSSHPIELNLHRIEGLAEHFVYFNDDMFLINKTRPEDFFKDGLPCDVFALYPNFPSDETMEYIRFNNVSIINKHFEKKRLKEYLSPKYLDTGLGKNLIQSLLLMPFMAYTGFYDPHLPNSYTKSLMKEVWEKEYDILYNTSKEKFRNATDVNQWLFRYWYLAQGKFAPRSPKIGKYFGIVDDNKEMHQTIQQQKCKMICCNDTGQYSDFELQKQHIKNSFDKILPNKSSFEL